MSEMFEGIVFRSTEPAAKQLFGNLTSALALKLVSLSANIHGIYRSASRHEVFQTELLCQYAESLSEHTQSALAVFYDNSCGLRTSVLFQPPAQHVQYGENDEWWVELDDEGNPQIDGRKFRVSEFLPEAEYQTIYSAIDAGLEAMRINDSISLDLLKNAFCYGKITPLMEK